MGEFMNTNSSGLDILEGEGHDALIPIYFSLDSLELAGQVLTQDVAQTPELRAPLPLQAEVERLARGHGIHGLELGIDAEDLQYCAVCLPEEAEPGRDQLAIRAVLRMHGREAWGDPS